MSNMQKAFKAKANSRGLRRAFAFGGKPDQSWMSEGERSLLGDFNTRKAGWDAALLPGVSTATSTLQASNALEDTNRNNTADLLKGRMDTVSSTAGLSSRQRNRSLASLASLGASQGVDTGFQPNSAGMSARGMDAINNSMLHDQITRNSFDLGRQQRGLTAELADSRHQFGFAGGGVPAAENGFFNFGRKPAPVPEVDPRLKQLEESAALRKSMAGYGADSAPAPVAPAPVPAAPAAPARGLMSLPGRRTELIDRVSGYNHGGIPHVDERGEIVDPGVPAHAVDKTPAKAMTSDGRKTNILVTPGERIVNKAQNAALEKLAKSQGMGLDEYLEHATGEPVGPTMKRGLRAAEFGIEIGPDGTRTFTDMSRSTAVVPRSVNWVPGGNPPSSGALPPPQPGTALVPRSVNWVPGGNPPAGPVVPVQPAAPAAPAAPVQPAAPAAWQRPSAMKVLSKVAGAAGTVGGLHEMSTGAQPADQVVGALKATSALPVIGTPIGATAYGGDMASNALTGKPLAHWLDKAAQFHPDYMRAADYEGKPTGRGDAASNAAAKAAFNGEAAQTAPKSESTAAEADAGESLQDRAGTGFANPPQNAKSLAYLRSMGVDTSKSYPAEQDVTTVNGNGPEKIKQGAYSIRNTANGPVYAGRNKAGQLVVTSGLDRSPEEQAAATKVAFDQATVQAARDKQTLRNMETDRYKRDAFDPSITDPTVRAAGLRSLFQRNHEDSQIAHAAQAQAANDVARARLAQEAHQHGVTNKRNDRLDDRLLAGDQEKRDDKHAAKMVGIIDKYKLPEEMRQSVEDIINANYTDLYKMTETDQRKFIQTAVADAKARLAIRGETDEETNQSVLWNPEDIASVRATKGKDYNPHNDMTWGDVRIGTPWNMNDGSAPNKPTTVDYLNRRFNPFSDRTLKGAMYDTPNGDRVRYDTIAENGGPAIRDAIRKQSLRNQ